MDQEYRARNTTYLNSLLSGENTQESFDHLFEATFTELHGLAAAIMSRERPDHTLQPTALVNEAYLRLFGANNLDIQGKAHFINIAAQAMRRILVEHARSRNAARRGGGRVPVTLYDIGVNDFPDSATILDLDVAMRKFAKLDERGARVAELRIFTGLGMAEIAEIIGVSRRTVQTDWRVASMWLRRALSPQDQD